MDEVVRATPTTVRWLAWATAGLLALGVVSAGVVDDGRPGPDADVVSAAGTASTVDVPPSTTTTALPTVPAVTPPPPPTPAQSTTVPKAAAAVLAAIGSTPPTTQPAPATTSTTRPPAPPTTSTTSTTTTTVPRRASATFVNRYPNDVQVTVGGRSLDLARNEQEGPVELALDADGRASIDVQVAGSECTKTTVRGVFEPGVVYRLAVVVSGPPPCEGFQGLNVVPA